MKVDKRWISLQNSICYFDNCRVATVDQNSPLWQPAMGSKTHMLWHQISAIHNKKALFPSLQRGLIEGL